MQDARTSLELFLIFLPHFASFRGFSCSLIPTLFCSFPFFSGFTCCSDSSSHRNSPPLLLVVLLFQPRVLWCAVGRGRAWEISAAEAHLDMVSTSLFGEPTVVGFAGGSDVWSWMFPPTSLRWAGVVGCVSFNVSFAWGPADSHPIPSRWAGGCGM